MTYIMCLRNFSVIPLFSALQLSNTKCLHLKLGPHYPRGALNFFDVCLPHGFQKVGSREKIFLEKMKGLENKNLENLHLES